jgi:DNA-binding CsgD family transcriptional regulator
MTSQLQVPPLTEREAEVLALLDRHMTNAEIAASLYISVRTVESHVSSMLRKLGVPDRRSLARSTASTEPATSCCVVDIDVCTNRAVASRTPSGPIGRRHRHRRAARRAVRRATG